jgi:quinol monooxygenase YgiN
MITLLVHIRVHEGKAARFEEILADMVAQTKASEPDCLAYEYYRGAEPNSYYCRLAFASKIAFYNHQNSTYHEGYLAEFAACFAALKLEYIDPVAAGGSGLDPTNNPALPADATGPLRDAETKYPIDIPNWWLNLRRT